MRDRTARAVAGGTARFSVNALRSALKARCRWVMLRRSLRAIAGWGRLSCFIAGDARVSQLITLHAGLHAGILKRGLQYTFKVAGAKSAVTFELNLEQVLAEASAGKWNADKTALTLSAKEAGEFTVTLLPKN